jgi:hypothetical protein
MSAMRLGRDSGFYGSAWFNMPPPETVIPGCPQLAFAQKRVMQHQIEITHFIKLVRQIGESQEDDVAKVEATELATKLYRADLEFWIEKLISTAAIETTPSSLPEVKPLFGISYTFCSTRLFHLLMYYWITRILICGGVQTLYSFLDLGSQPLNLSSVQNHEIQAAERIAMSFEYAWTYDAHLPVVALRVQMPLHIAFSAWHRLEKRELERITNGYRIGVDGVQRAVELKEWCLRTGHKIEELISEARTTQEYLELMSDSQAGGQLFPAI